MHAFKAFQHFTFTKQSLRFKMYASSVVAIDRTEIHSVVHHMNDQVLRNNFHCSIARIEINRFG